MSGTAFVRRVAAIVATATGVLAAGPFVGSASALTSTPTKVPGAGQTVGKHPTISATYDKPLLSISTISVTGNKTTPPPDSNHCSSQTVVGMTITCNLSGDLDDALNQYTVQVVAVSDPAVDMSGTNVVNTSWTFNVDSQAPTFSGAVTMTNPVIASNQASAAVSGTISDAHSTTVNVSVNDTNPATPAVTGSVSTTGAFSVPVNLTSLSDGTLTATVTATDVYGNGPVSGNSPTATKDTTGPALQSSTPVDNTSVQPTGQVIGTFSEALNTSTSQVHVFDRTNTEVAGIPSGPSFSNANKTITFTSSDPTLAESGSPYAATFDVVDVNGNPTTTTIHFAVDHTPPNPPTSVTLVDPVNLANQTTAAVTGTAEPGSTVTVSVDDTSPAAAVSGTTQADQTTGEFTKQLNLTSLADGTLTATVYATDLAGNQGTASTDTATKDTARPPVNSVTITDPVTHANQTTATVTGNAEPGSTVTISVDDATVGSPVTATVPADGVTGDYASGPLDLSSLADGTITATVFATDTHGNPTSPAVTKMANKDAGLPATPTVVFSPDKVNNSNKTAITITGNAEAGSGVDISVDDEDSGTLPVTAHVTAGGGGTYTTASPLDLSGLTDGTLTATVTATDGVGNVSAAGTGTAPKDVLVPNAPVVVVGPYVNTATLPVSGTAEPGATINVSVTDGTHTPTTGTATANGNGDWSTTVNVSTLNEVTLTVTATATDAVGNVSPNGTGTTKKDVTAPAQPTASLPSVTSSNVTNVALTGTAEDGSTVHATLDDSDTGTPALTGSATATGGSYTIHFDASSLTDGTLTAVAYATDPAGNDGPTKTVTASKDTIDLALLSTSPVDGSTVSSASPISGTYNEPLNPATTTISVKNGANTTVAGSKSFSGDNKTVMFTPSSVLTQAGSPYTVTFDGKDVAGDQVTTVTTFTIDTTAPGIPTVQMDNPVNLANKNAVAVTGVAEAGSSVLISIDDAANGATAPVTQTVSAANDGAYTGSLNVTSLSDGTLTATVTATDVAGNAGSPGTATATKDTVAPLAPSANLPAAVNAANKTSVPISGTGEALQTVTYSVTSSGGAGTVSGTTPIDGAGDWSVNRDLSSLPDGTLTLTAFVTDAYDNAGPNGTDTAPKDVGIPAAPSVALTKPVNAANKGSVSVSGVAEAGSLVAVTLDDADSGTAALTDTVTADGTTGEYAFSFDTTSLTDGSLLASVTAADAVGNTSLAGTDTATKDTVAPGVPTIAAHGTVSHVDYQAVDLSGTAEDGATVQVSVTDGTAAPVVGTTSATGGDWSVTLDLSSLADGTLSVSVIATDAAQNPSSAGTGSLLKNTSRAFTLTVTANPVSGTAYGVTVTAHLTYDPTSGTDTAYTGTPTLDSLDGKFAAGSCPAATNGVADCTGVTFGDLGAQTLMAASGTGSNAVTGTKAVTVQPTALAFTSTPSSSAAPGQSLSFTVAPQVGVPGASTTGYAATRKLVTTGGSTPANDTDLTCSTPSCTFTVSFASRGPKTVKVVDNGTPPLETTLVTINIPYLSATSMTVSKGLVLAGNSTTLSGLVRNVSLNAGVGAVTVKLYRKTAPATTYALFATLSTAGDGSFSKTISLTRNTTYQARYAGDALHTAANSPLRTVFAAQKVTATYSLSGHTLTVKGAISPSGAAGHKVSLWLKKADGSYVSVAASTVTGSLTYTLSRTFAKGTYTLRVVVAKDTLNAAGYSVLRTFTFS